MFGYIQPDKPYLFHKDETLYQALYCGLCKSIGGGCGQTARTLLTYDMAFVSALFHNIRNEDVTIEKKRCLLHPFKKRPVAKPDELSILLGCVNTAFGYFKLCDDREDGDRRGMLAFLYKRGFTRVLKRHPAVGDIVKDFTDAQRAVEKKQSSIIDEACEPTALAMQKLSRYVLKEYSTPQTEQLFYDIGKWVYLADALDDYDKDVKKGRYNVLYNCYRLPTKQQAFEMGREELLFLFDSLFADMRENLAQIHFYFNHDLTDNILLRGIPLKTRRLFYGRCGEGKKELNHE
jgi:hypothetical protein